MSWLADEHRLRYELVFYFSRIETSQHISLLLVAGGVGSRLGADIPKQYIEVAGKPILFHTLDALCNCFSFEKIVIAMAPEWIPRWDELAAKANFKGSVLLAPGGETRFHSVQNALKVLAPTGGVVAIHDAVRPVLDRDMLLACEATARAMDAAIPVIEMRESLRILQGDQSKSVDRSNYVAVQTPQCFEANLLLKAYAQEYDAEFTDDATVVEKVGHEIALVQGSSSNKKITYPEDIDWLERQLS